MHGQRPISPRYRLPYGLRGRIRREIPQEIRLLFLAGSGDSVVVSLASSLSEESRGGEGTVAGCALVSAVRGDGETSSSK